MVDVAEIKRNVSPVEAIERYTGAKRTHNKYPCPFHLDRHPSLSVKADKWTCWSCGKSGDVINFVQLYFGLSFKDACAKIAQDYSLDIVVPEPKVRDIWDDIEAEIRKERQQELKKLQQEIDREIELFTTAHRVLFRLGNYKDAERYAQEIDDLVAYKATLR